MTEKAAGAEVRGFAAKRAEERLERLTVEMSRVVQSRNADAVHDLRTSIRRLMQALRVFEPFFRDGHPRRIRRKLKQIMALAGDVRNCDIGLKLLAESGAAVGADAAARLRCRQQDALHELVVLLKTCLSNDLLSEWRAGFEIATDAPRKPVGKAAPELLMPMADKFFELGKRAVRDKAGPEELHRFRIAGKKFRYSLELFAPLYGSSLNPLLKKIARAQDILGNINDCETVRKMMSDYKGTGDFRKWLRKKQRRKTTKFRKYWRKAEAGKQDWRGLPVA